MAQLYVCPLCGLPVADRPRELWTSAFAPTGDWRHLADNTPLCHNPGTDQPAQPALIDEADPDDPETQPWREVMVDELFTITGPFALERTAAAQQTLERLTAWLHAATGPAAAPRTLPHTADIARLAGGIYRIARQLARINVQAGEHLGATMTPQTGADGQTSYELPPAAANAGRNMRAAAEHLADAASCAARGWIAADAVRDTNPPGPRLDQAARQQPADPPARATLVDNYFGATGHSYELTRVYRLGGHIVRLRIYRDAYPHQSYAIAELLAPGKTWTRLAVERPSTWHDETPHEATAPPDRLVTLADSLLRRATTILGH